MRCSRRLAKSWPLLALLLVLAWLALPVHAEPQAAADEAKPATVRAAVVKETWSLLSINDAPAGYTHEVVSRDGDEFITTITTSMRMRRGPIEIPVEMIVVYRETATGELREMSTHTAMSQQKTFTQYEFGDERVDVLTRQGGRELEQRKPLPEGEWLTPREVEQFISRRLEAGAEEIVYRTLVAEGGLIPVQIRHERTGEEKVESLGKTVPVTVWKTRTSLMPGVQGVTHFGPEGETVYSRIDMGGLSMVTRLATAEEAREVGGQQAPELMLTLFIPIDQEIERPRETTRARYRVTAKQGDLVELPSIGAQRVEMNEDGRTAIVAVDITDPLPASAGELDDPDFTEPSLAVDGSDPLIRKLAARAVEGVPEDDVMARAEALRAFAFEHITGKGLETAFATASETARHRTGDCSEHGVLLAALLRAEGIPSRLATGVVYAGVIEGEKPIFGWHMWTQALIDGKWIDLDATLPVTYDAAHLLTGVAALSDGESMSDLNQMMGLLGNIEIELLDVGWRAD